MRAVVLEAFGSVDTLAIREIPEPGVGPGQVRIRVDSVGLGFADTLVIEGKYQIKPTLPFVPGGQTAGIVDAIGDGVSHVSPGDPVMCSSMTGGMAELTVARADRVFPMPSGLDCAAAAGFIVSYATSYHALKDRGRLEPGETLLVLGAAGAVGQTAVELGKALGATVIAAASSAEKLAMASERGADLTINYAEQDLRERIKALTRGRGVDVIYDPVGGELGQTAFRDLAWGGRHLVIGFASGTIPALPYNIALLKGAALVGVDVVQFSTTKEPEKSRANVLELIRMCDAGKLRPRGGIVYPLERVGDALRAAASRDTVGRVVLQIRPT
jgi:NADPH2:quinone reductase